MAAGLDDTIEELTKWACGKDGEIRGELSEAGFTSSEDMCDGGGKVPFKWFFLVGGSGSWEQVNVKFVSVKNKIYRIKFFLIDCLTVISTSE